MTAPQAIVDDAVEALKASRADIKAQAGVNGLVLGWFVGRLAAMGGWLFRFFARRLCAWLRDQKVGAILDAIASFAGPAPTLAKSAPSHVAAPSAMARGMWNVAGPDGRIAYFDGPDAALNEAEAREYAAIKNWGRA